MAREHRPEAVSASTNYRAPDRRHRHSSHCQTSPIRPRRIPPLQATPLPCGCFSPPTVPTRLPNTDTAPTSASAPVRRCCRVQPVPRQCATRTTHLRRTVRHRALAGRRSYLHDSAPPTTTRARTPPQTRAAPLAHCTPPPAGRYPSHSPRHAALAWLQAGRRGYTARYNWHPPAHTPTPSPSA